MRAYSILLDILLQMTWRNPIFMMLAIGALWFIPGALIRRLAERKYNEEKKALQARKISKLYPKK